jgi:4'-phosphopantetheinyl transferase
MLIKMDQNTKTLKRGTVHIWFTKINPWKERLVYFKSILSDEELKRINQLVFSDRQDDFIVSRGILRMILANYLSAPPEFVEINKHSNGKPYLPGSKIEFNISHSNAMWLCAISLIDPVGIDLQHVYPISHMNTIIKNYFSVDEQLLLKSAPENRILDLFFTIWTAKEAYLKGIGEGFTRSPTSFSICQKENDLIYLSLRGNDKSDQPSDWYIREIHIASDYKAALAVKGNLIHIETKPYLMDKNTIHQLSLPQSDFPRSL